VKDLERVGRVLRAKRKPDHAEEVLSRALERAVYPADQARIRMTLGWCALDMGRVDEALSTAELILNDQSRYSMDANWDIRAGTGELRVHALLTRNEPEKALALCDTELTRDAARWGRASSRALHWIPVLARALRRTGRARDAEVILRKLLDLPLEFDAATVALGLSSRAAVLSFLHAPAGRIFMDPRQRRIAQAELGQALRAQGRHLEADAIDPQRKTEGPPT
jgi:tetratricopeptide (TPR) repeat protein